FRRPHIKCLREIFKATRSMGFTLSPTKCLFASPTITLLGRHLHRSDHKFHPGGVVLYNWPQASDHKLTPPFKVCYLIRNVGRTEDKIVHVQTLKHFEGRPQLNLDLDTSTEQEETPPLPTKVSHPRLVWKCRVPKLAEVSFVRTRPKTSTETADRCSMSADHVEENANTQRLPGLCIVM
ncbi:hypothetical protein HPB47_013434, partial [Ixodes persulcatus]